jgi:hypothetical protein
MVNTKRTTGCTDEGQKWLKPSEKLQKLYPKGEFIQFLVTGKQPGKRKFLPDRGALDQLAALLEKHNLRHSSMHKVNIAQCSMVCTVLNNFPY